MFNLDERLIARLKKEIKGDDINGSGMIGGKNIIIEKEGTLSYILDMAMHDYTIAIYNFVLRRSDLMMGDSNDNIKIYYGHVGFLGYFIAEDEIEIGPDKLTEELLDTYMYKDGE